MKDQQDYENASAEDIWQYCLPKYKSKNPITRWIVNNFYSKIKLLIGQMEGLQKVLEVGCGIGQSSRIIGKILNGIHFEASELDERFLQKLKEDKFPFKLTKESVYELQRQDNEFDCIFLLEVMEHLDDYELALQELFRVSRKYVIISVPNEPLWRILNLLRGKYWRYGGNTIGHVNNWTPQQLKQLISRYGTVKNICFPIPWTIVLAEVKQ